MQTHEFPFQTLLGGQVVQAPLMRWKPELQTQVVPFQAELATQLTQAPLSKN